MARRNYRDCARCGKEVYVAVWGKHRRMCDALPPPEILAKTMYDDPDLRVVDLWAQYSRGWIGVESMKERLLLGGMSSDDLYGRVGSVNSDSFKRRWGETLKESRDPGLPKCKVCTILLSADGVTDSGDGLCADCVGKKKMNVSYGMIRNVLSGLEFVADFYRSDKWRK